jgi:hypothetical protein
MVFTLKRQTVADKPLMAVLYGLPTSGKSTALGTFNKPTLILHTAEESHGARAAVKVADSMGNQDVYCVNISILEESDIEAGLFKEGTPSNLTSDQKWDKLMFYLQNVPEGIGAVGIDSLTEIFRYLNETKIFIRMCTKESAQKGSFYDTWSERPAYIKMLHHILASAEKLRCRGLDVVMTIAGKGKFDDQGEMIALEPDLPQFGVAEETIKSFSDIIPVRRKVVENSEGIEVERVVFDLNLIVGKVQRESAKKNSTTPGKIKNVLRSYGRLASFEESIPFGFNIECLPADFSQLKTNIERLKEISEE